MEIAISVYECVFIFPKYGLRKLM